VTEEILDSIKKAGGEGRKIGWNGWCGSAANAPGIP